MEGRDFGLEVRDYAGRIVRLHHQNWVEHLKRHDEIARYHGMLVMVLQQPQVVVEDEGDERRYYYRLGVGEGRLRGLYFQIIVGIGDDVIRTAFFVPAPHRGTVVHLRWS
jgi:hypothetical protein